MAASSKNEENLFVNIKSFPPVINGRINLAKFLEASTDLVTVVERLGTVFAPVKYDMQGNIDKIKRNLNYNEYSCLLDLMINDISEGKYTAVEAVLWLNRALLFFELALLEILRHLRSNHYDVNMKKIFTVAYEGSVKKYHKWVTQQLFTFICKMSPTLPQIMKSFAVNDDVKAFEQTLDNFNVTLHLVRCKLDDFFRDNNVLNKLSDK